MKLLNLFFCSVLFFSCKSETKTPEEVTGEGSAVVEQQDTLGMSGPEIIPISHATAVIQWDGSTIYLDPVGGADAFEGTDDPDLVLITDIHGDHMDPETIDALDLGEVTIIAPRAVKEQLPDSLGRNLVVLNNGETVEELEFSIEAVPMYNLREEAKQFHPKGRGNGYILEKDGRRLYIAGDTEDIPEMRNLKDIDIALIPMNLPYTMTVEKAADAVLDFEPGKVYPYHFRGSEGKSNVEKFKELVNQGNKKIEVVLLEWYPEEKE